MYHWWQSGPTHASELLAAMRQDTEAQGGSRFVSTGILRLSLAIVIFSRRLTWNNPRSHGRDFVTASSLDNDLSDLEPILWDIGWCLGSTLQLVGKCSSLTMNLRLLVGWLHKRSCVVFVQSGFSGRLQRSPRT